MDAGTHARVEEEKPLDSFRLRSSARLGFASSASIGSCRVTRRKRKKRRRQRRNSSGNTNEELVVAVAVGGTVASTVASTSSSSATIKLEAAAEGGEPARGGTREEECGPAASTGGQLDSSASGTRNRASAHTTEPQVPESRTGGSGTRVAASSVSSGITLLNRRAGKRSSRRCNASGRRNAMTMDLQRLITEVHARPAIWDQKNVNYHNRDVILKMWREIARACEVSPDVAKSKWKHLRDNFRNELKKSYRGKYEGGGNEHDSKWVWFKSLFFLRDQMNSRVIGCALSQNSSANLLRSSPDGTQIEPQIDILEGHEETQFEDLDGDSCQSLLSNDDALHQVMPPPKLNKIGRKRSLIDAIENEYGEIDRKRYESLQKRLAVAHEDVDDTYHFLMSVRNPLRSLPLDRQMFVRLKIQELVYNEINSQSQHCQQNQQNRTYEAAQDVKPPRVGGTGNPGVNAIGNPGTGAAAGNPTGNDVVGDMSNTATLLQNCTTEGSGDDAFFG